MFVVEVTGFSKLWVLPSMMKGMSEQTRVMFYARLEVDQVQKWG